MRTRLTLREVAMQAGVHPSTASRALNPATRSLVNPETADRVIGIARSVGYLPNRIARNLRTRRSFTVGVLVPDITNPFFPPILRGLEDVLLANGYTTLIANTDEEAHRESKAYETFIEQQVEGLVVGVASLQDQLFEAAVKSRIPLVLMNRQVGRSDIPAVCSDDDHGMALAVEHLASLGHRSIAHLAGSLNSSTGAFRQRAFMSAMASFNLPVNTDFVVVSDRLTEEAGEVAAIKLFSGAEKPTAVVAATDMLALGCYDALVKCGLSCPSDVSVVGHNDVRFVDKVQPPLTTVRVPQYELGALAAKALLEQMSDREQVPRTTMLQPRLVVRGSTAAPRQP